MKDSFLSFCDVQPEEWRINIRGSLKHQAGEFLMTELGDQLILHYRDSREGWFYDSLSFMKAVKSDFVFFWIEDHICLVEPEEFRDVINEMQKLYVDQLQYSWFQRSTWRTFAQLPIAIEGDHIVVFKYDDESAMKARNVLQEDFYIVSAVSIYKKEFFLSILQSNRPFLKRWPKHLPFDFEKKSKDQVASLIMTGMPKKELFAAIDDDHGNPGYSLLSRGMYPNRLSRAEIKALEFRRVSPKFRLMFLPGRIRLFLISLYLLLRRVGYSLSYFY